MRRSLSAICVFLLVIAMSVGIPLSLNHAALNAQVPTAPKATLPIFGGDTGANISVGDGNGFWWDNFTAEEIQQSNVVLNPAIPVDPRRLGSPIDYMTAQPAYTALVKPGFAPSPLDGKLIGDSITSVYGWRRINQMAMAYGASAYLPQVSMITQRLSWMRNGMFEQHAVSPGVGISEDFYGIEINAGTGEGLATMTSIQEMHAR